MESSAGSSSWIQCRRYVIVILVAAQILQIVLFDSVAQVFLAAQTQQEQAVPPKPAQRYKIAILSSYITEKPSGGGMEKRLELTDHMVNKACYANFWGYDYIFNTTPSYDVSSIGHRHWLSYGSWHRVGHIEALLPRYDWVLYTDVDYVFKDLARPLESFLREFEFHGLNPHVFVPRDEQLDGYYAFSAFAVMVRNSDFGRSVLHRWKEFGRGLCRNGNLAESKPDEYVWYDGDQVGLWYALIKTHMEFFPNDVFVPDFPVCNETTGFMAAGQGGPWMKMTEYFMGNGLKLGNYGSDLSMLPKDQPIIWSTCRNESRSGLGLQMDWIDDEDELPWSAFAIHTKDMRWPGDMLHELEVCKTEKGCYANYSESELDLRIGCFDRAYA